MQKHVDGYRELTNQLSKELADERKRSNGLHDVLVQFLAGDLRVVHKDQLPKRRGEAA